MDEHDSRKEKLYLIGRSSNNLWTEGSEYKGRGASMGGDIPANHLLTYLEKSIKSADSIDIIVSFLMESGVRLLLPALKNALDRGAAIRLLTGNYLGITQPSALTLLKYELETESVSISIKKRTVPFTQIWRGLLRSACSQGKIFAEGSGYQADC